jgi:hypothetical protein
MKKISFYSVFTLAFLISVLSCSTLLGETPNNDAQLIKGFWRYVNTSKNGEVITRKSLSVATPTVYDLAIGLNTLQSKPSSVSNNIAQPVQTSNSEVSPLLTNLGRTTYDSKEIILLLDPTFVYQFGGFIPNSFAIKHKTGNGKIESVSSNKQNFTITPSVPNKLTINDVKILDNKTSTKTFTIVKVSALELILSDEEFNELHVFKRTNF